MIIEEETLREANTTLAEAQGRDPRMSGRAEKTRLAVAYFIVSIKKGRKMSMYEAEELFDVSDAPFRRFYKSLSANLGFKVGRQSKERSRNAYDLYAEILSNEGETLTGLIRKIHVKTSELKKHISHLRERGLLVSRRTYAAHCISRPRREWSTSKRTRGSSR